MDTPEETLASKMTKLGQLHNAVRTARRERDSRPNPDTALALQALQEQVKSLRATLPPLRLAASRA